MGVLRIVTGAIGSGKTTLVRRRADEVRALGGRISGVITEVRRDERWAIDLLSGESWRLAGPNDGRSARLTTPRYAFDDEGISRCNDTLRNSLPAELFVVDELGPLEFERGEGFTDAFSILDSGEFVEALVVVRESLLERVQMRWPDAEVIQVGISTEYEDERHSACQGCVDVV